MLGLIGRSLNQDSVLTAVKIKVSGEIVVYVWVCGPNHDVKYHSYFTSFSRIFERHSYGVSRNTEKGHLDDTNRR